MSDPIEVLRTLRDRYSHNRHAVLALDAAIASLSASKPESAEAVGEVLRSGNGVARVAMFNDSLRPGTKVYTAPPRPEAGEERCRACGLPPIAAGKPPLETCACARLTYTAPQQASAPVGVELVDAARAVVEDHTDYSARVRLRKALAQQPAAVNPEDVHVESYPEQFGGFRVGSPRGIKVTHKSGLIVISTKERSAHANRDVAMRSLAWALAGQQQGGASNE